MEEDKYSIIFFLIFIVTLLLLGGCKEDEVQVQTLSSDNSSLADEIGSEELEALPTPTPFPTEDHLCLEKRYKKDKSVTIINKKKVIDNFKRGYKEFGTWSLSSLLGFKKKSSRYTFDENAHVEYKAIVKRKHYCLSLYRVTYPNSVHESHVRIFQGDELLKEVIFDDAVAGSYSGWSDLGRFEFDPKKLIKVTITRGDGVPGALRSDALKFKHCACQNP